MNKPLQHPVTVNHDGGAGECHKRAQEGPLTLTWTPGDLMFKLRPKRQAAGGQERAKVEFWEEPKE